MDNIAVLTSGLNRKELDYYKFLSNLKPLLEKKESTLDFKCLCFAFLSMDAIGYPMKKIKSYLSSEEGENESKKYWRIFSYCATKGLLSKFKSFSYVKKLENRDICGTNNGRYNNKILIISDFNGLASMLDVPKEIIKEEDFYLRKNINYFGNL